MRFKCTEEILSKVCKHEERMLFEYNRIAEKYKEAFDKYQCALKIEMRWYNCMSIKYKSYNYRIPLTNGYICCIDFSVQKNGEDVKLESEDGEVDYYSLGDSTNISEITWLLVCRRISLSTDTDYFEEELIDYLETLERYYAQGCRLF